MAIAQKRLSRAEAAAHAGSVSVRVPAGLLARAASRVGRALVGTGGPRNYPSQKLPDHELYQLVSGHRDRFDGWS